MLRDQGNSAYMRDTGDPTTPEGGQIEWGYYETDNPRLCHPDDILEKEEARLSPSQRDLEMDQIMEPLERAMELTPILGEIGYNEAEVKAIAAKAQIPEYNKNTGEVKMHPGMPKDHFPPVVYGGAGGDPHGHRSHARADAPDLAGASP